MKGEVIRGIPAITDRAASRKVKKDFLGKFFSMAKPLGTNFLAKSNTGNRSANSRNCCPIHLFLQGINGFVEETTNRLQDAWGMAKSSNAQKIYREQPVTIALAMFLRWVSCIGYRVGGMYIVMINTRT